MISIPNFDYSPDAISVCLLDKHPRIADEIMKRMSDAVYGMVIAAINEGYDGDLYVKYSFDGDKVTIISQHGGIECAPSESVMRINCGDVRMGLIAQGLI